MDLTKKLDGEIDFNLLKGFSSLLIAKNIINKFEKYYGQLSTEQDFYKAYLKYAKCKKFYGKVFNSYGTIKKSRICYLNSPKLTLKQVKLIEDYFLHKKIIYEKTFNE